MPSSDLALPDNAAMTPPTPRTSVERRVKSGSSVTISFRFSRPFPHPTTTPSERPAQHTWEERPDDQSDPSAPYASDQCCIVGPRNDSTGARDPAPLSQRQALPDPWRISPC